jgi:hypothetical protein
MTANVFLRSRKSQSLAFSSFSMTSFVRSSYYPYNNFLYGHGTTKGELTILLLVAYEQGSFTFGTSRNSTRRRKGYVESPLHRSSHLSNHCPIFICWKSPTPLPQNPKHTSNRPKRPHQDMISNLFTPRPQCTLTIPLHHRRLHRRIYHSAGVMQRGTKGLTTSPESSTCSARRVHSPFTPFAILQLSRHLPVVNPSGSPATPQLQISCRTNPLTPSYFLQPT